jgi:hypothetical protein
LAPQFRVWFSRIQAFSTWQTRQIHSPRHWLGGAWRQGWGLVWLILQTACSFMMISPKLHAIWPVFFLNLSQYLIVILLMLILGPWATANYCRAGIKSLRGTHSISEVCLADNTPHCIDPRNTCKYVTQLYSTGYLLLSRFQNVCRHLYCMYNIVFVDTCTVQNTVDDMQTQIQYVIVHEDTQKC